MTDQPLVMHRLGLVLLTAAGTGRVPPELTADLAPADVHALVSGLAIGLVDAAGRTKKVPLGFLIELAEIEAAAASGGDDSP